MSRADPRDKETKQEPIIGGFDERFGANIDSLSNFGACSLLKLSWWIMVSLMQLKVREKLKD
jgi:hypothetical protein